MKIEALWNACSRCRGTGIEDVRTPWDEIEPVQCRACGGRRGRLTEIGREINDLLRVVERLDQFRLTG